MSSRTLMDAIHVTLGRAALQASLQAQRDRAAARIVHDTRASAAVVENDRVQAELERVEQGEEDAT